MTTDQVGDAAFGAGVRLHELSTHRASLEQAFMELTADSVEYQATVQTGHAAGAAPAGVPAGPPPPQENENEHAGRTN